MLPELEFSSPGSLAGCLEQLALVGEEGMPIAGGTNLIPDLRSGRRRPGTVVNLCEIRDLSYIRKDNGHVVMGGLVNIEQVKQSALLAQSAPALVASARLFASPLIRHRATLGGNLADSSPAADTAPPLLALGAEVALDSVEGKRYMPLDTFFLGPRRTARRNHELLTEIRYPAPPTTARNNFLKLGLRNADAISVVSVAAYLDLEGETVREVRIALGAVAPVPVRAKRAEAALKGEKLTEEAVREAARLAAQEDARPIDDVRGSAEYRRWMVEVMVRRALWEG